MKPTRELLLVVSAAGALAGCARIGTKPATFSDEPLRSVEKYVPLEKPVAAIKQDGVTVNVALWQGCNRQRFQEVRRTHHDERVNETPAVDYALAVVGAGAAITGAALLADSGNVYEKDETARQYNPVGKGTAQAIGGTTLAVGGVLLTIPVVDAARAAGTAERETREELPGEVLESEVACPGKPMAATMVEGRFGTKEVELGATDANGRLVLDLVPFAIEEAEARQAPRMSVYVGDVVVGTIDLLPLADARRHATDTEAWESAGAESCRTLKHSGDCEGVRDYLKDFPGGEHAREAKDLLFTAEPKIPELRDDEKWKAAGAEACLAGEAEDACAMVAQYVETYPDGNHIDEAKKVLEKGKKTIKMNAARKRAQDSAAACNNACAAQCSAATNKEACIRACKKTEASCAH